MRILYAALLAATACRRETRASTSQDNASQPPSPPPAATAAASRATLFPPGSVMRGDAAMLRQYLQAVDTVQGARVDVKYAPQTVFIARDAAIRSLRGASWDGAVWRFAAGEPAVASLRPGSVMVVWGLAFRRVTAVAHINDELVVRTEPAAFSDAVVDAHISWDAPLNVAQGVVSVQSPEPADSVSFHTALLAPSPHPLVRFASFTSELAPATIPADSEEADPAELYQHSFKLEVKDYKVALAYGGAGGEALNFYVQVAKGETGEEDVELPETLAETYASKFGDALAERHGEDAKEAKEGRHRAQEIREQSRFGKSPGALGIRGGPAAVPGRTEEQQRQADEEERNDEIDKRYGQHAHGGGAPNVHMPEVPLDWRGLLSGVWDKVKEQTAIKVTAVGHVTGLRSRGELVYSGGRFESANFDYPDLRNVVDIRAVARTDQGVFASNTMLKIPITFRVPFIMGGLPFVFEVGTALIAAPGLTSKHASAKLALHFEMGEHLTMKVSGASVDANAEPDVTAEKLPETSTTSLGPSAVMVALQGPRVGLGMGVVGTNVMAYFDFVMSSSTVSTGELGLIHCTRSLTFINSAVGVEASVLGIKVNDLLPKQVQDLARHSLFEQKRWEWTDPEGVRCQ